MSLAKMFVGQKVVVSFRDAPDHDGIVIDFDKNEVTRALSKGGDVSIRVLLKNPNTGKFSQHSVVQSQISQFGSAVEV